MKQTRVDRAACALRKALPDRQHSSRLLFDPEVKRFALEGACSTICFQMF